MTNRHEQRIVLKYTMYEVAATAMIYLTISLPSAHAFWQRGTEYLLGLCRFCTELDVVGGGRRYRPSTRMAI